MAPSAVGIPDCFWLAVLSVRCPLTARVCSLRGRGSAGRAQPCQGWGRGFESRRPLKSDLKCVFRQFRFAVVTALGQSVFHDQGKGWVGLTPPLRIHRVVRVAANTHRWGIENQ